MKTAREAGASVEEITQSVSDALSVKKSSVEIMSDYAFVRLRTRRDVRELGRSEETNRMKELISVGAAFAVNCVSNLDRHLTAARAMGVSNDEVAEIFTLSNLIKAKAASHVERIVKGLGAQSG